MFRFNKPLLMAKTRVSYCIETVFCLYVNKGGTDRTADNGGSQFFCHDTNAKQKQLGL